MQVSIFKTVLVLLLAAVVVAKCCLGVELIMTSSQYAVILLDSRKSEEHRVHVLPDGLGNMSHQSGQDNSHINQNHMYR